MYDSEMAGVEFQLRKKEKSLFFIRRRMKGGMIAYAAWVIAQLGFPRACKAVA